MQETPSKDLQPRRGALQIIRNEHASLAAILGSLLQMLERGPGDTPEQFFDVVRAMLFYIDEFPEKNHHPKESRVLFPMIVRAAPELKPVIDALELEHSQGHARVRELQHQLLSWELLGDGYRKNFEKALRAYVPYYLHHMRVEETELLSLAEQRLSAGERAALDAAFRAHRDPMSPQARDPAYERLFTRILMHAPAPIGVGPG